MNRTLEILGSSNPRTAKKRLYEESLQRVRDTASKAVVSPLKIGKKRVTELASTSDVRSTHNSTSGDTVVIESDNNQQHDRRFPEAYDAQIL